MAEEFDLGFPDRAAIDNAMERLHKSRIGTEPLFQQEQTDAPRVKVGRAVYDLSADDRAVSLPDGDRIRFGELFYRIHGVRSGWHHPDGCFWVQSTSPRQVTDQAPLTAVVDTVYMLGAGRLFPTAAGHTRRLTARPTAPCIQAE